MRDFIPAEMRKFVPLIAFGLAAFYTVSAAVNMQKTAACITNGKSESCRAGATIAAQGGADRGRLAPLNRFTNPSSGC